ncbi:MAG: RidA family protein [Cyanobacteria bacterium REEB65]|nr:RidA family protein [Cyanobacteria bacterium REEB65]
MRAFGGLLWVSGISARQPDSSLPPGGIREQTRAILENLREILARAGADLSHLVDVTVFLLDMADYAGYNEVYNTFFDAQTGPTRTTVGVKQLPLPGLLLEIQAVACDPRAR